MLMPRFLNPWVLPVREAVKYIDNFLRGTDEVLTFNLIGGEPLLYNDLPILLEHLQACDKVKRITLSTNCTITPDERLLEAFRLDKVEIRISDYGNLAQTAKIIELLEKSEINIEVPPDQRWLDFGGTHYRDKDEETLKNEFRRCYVASDCKAVYRDKYFVCERAARMFMLGDIYDASRDYVDLDLSADDHERLVRGGVYVNDVACRTRSRRQCCLLPRLF